MNSEQYKQAAGEVTDYIAEYLETIRKRHVFPDVEPGYLRALVPAEPPRTAEPWSAIFADFDRVIMPGVTHWQSPYMHAYFPALNSYPSLLGDMLADAINCIGFTWASSPACTELEALVMDWLAKMIGLPDKFVHTSSKTAGGGIIQSTLSDATFVSILAARNNVIAQQVPPSLSPRVAAKQEANGNNNNNNNDKSGQATADAYVKWRGELSARLVAYCSDQSHSSVEKACFASLIELRVLPCGNDFAMHGKVLEDAIIEDINRGKVPFYVCATLGTTGCCAFDHLEEIGAVCEQYHIWLHVDAAYAGSAFICPEFQHFMKGINYAQSFAFNPSKWLMVHFDCTAMWVADSRLLHRTFNVDPLYLQHDKAGAAIDYMHWQIPLSRRFRSLKLWFVIRTYGVTGLQSHIRQGVERAKFFEQLVSKDSRFEIPAKRHLGLIVFRLKGENSRTERLLKALNQDRRIHCVPASLKGAYVIRFTVTSTRTTVEDISRDWSIIQHHANDIVGKSSILELKLPPKAKQFARLLSNGSIERAISHDESTLPVEGLSLILSNVPDSPRIINCSYAAIKGDTQVEKIFAEFAQSGSWSSTPATTPPLVRSSAMGNGDSSPTTLGHPANIMNGDVFHLWPSAALPPSGGAQVGRTKSNGSTSASATPQMARAAIANSANSTTQEAPADLPSSSSSTNSISSTKQKLKAEASNKAEQVFSAFKTGFKSLGSGIASIAHNNKTLSSKNSKK